ncbi:MAG: response regulator transcription factor [Actinomycetota bacterium]|nr:response regulator transcription factor [Actinomycetota bacterium]
MRRMFIVGNDAFLVGSMRVALRYLSGINVVGLLDDEDGFEQAIREAEPDFVIIDANGDPNRALRRLRTVRAELPAALAIVVTAEAVPELLADVAELGAIGCVGGTSLLAQLNALLAESPARDAGRGHVAVAVAGARDDGPPAAPVHALPPPPVCPLTARELEILRSVAKGHTNARIGRELWVTEQTVKFHLSKVYRKLGVANRTEASRYALLNDLFEAPRHERRPVARHGLNGNGNGAVPSGRPILNAAGR